MNNEVRREKLLEILQNATESISGAALSKELNVTRQVIVSDITILRCSGYQILSSTKGYLMASNESAQKSLGYHVIACKGEKLNEDELRSEFYTVVDNGGGIRGIYLKSPLYGEIQVKMDLHCRRDVEQYLTQMKELNAPFIAVITNGAHCLNVRTHTADEAQEIVKSLNELGLLDKDKEDSNNLASTKESHNEG